MINRLSLFLAALLVAAPAAFADTGDDERSIAPDPARPAVGEWLGQVSWSSAFVGYAWRINPDGAFSSGRVGRGYSGGGAWGVHGARVTLKYTNGLRYEGEVQGDAYSGEAYLANGRAIGGFSMARAVKREPEDAP